MLKNKVEKQTEISFNRILNIGEYIFYWFAASLKTNVEFNVRPPKSFERFSSHFSK